MTTDRSRCSSGDCGNGEGVFHWEDGATYTGQFYDGRPHGRGRFVAPNGHTITGDWKDGRPNGHAVSTHPNGASYEGEYVDGKPDGEGTETLANGLKLNGRFRGGKPDGPGRLYDSTGRLLLEGTFNRGSFPQEYKTSSADPKLVKDTEAVVLLLHKGCTRIQKLHAFAYDLDPGGKISRELWIFDVCGKAHGQFLRFVSAAEGGTRIELAMGRDNKPDDTAGRVEPDRKPFEAVIEHLKNAEENLRQIRDPEDKQRIRRRLKELEALVN